MLGRYLRPVAGMFFDSTLVGELLQHCQSNVGAWISQRVNVREGDDSLRQCRLAWGRSSPQAD
jgi:hypothetical protein